MSVTSVINARSDVVCLHKYVPNKKERKWKKQTQVTQCRDTLWVCWDGARKVKSHIKFYLVREVKDNKKGFHSTSSAKGRLRKIRRGAE